MKSTYTVLIMLLGVMYCNGQSIPGYSDREIDEAYNIINIQYSSGLLLNTSKSSTGYDGKFINYELLNSGNRERTSEGIFKITPYVDFDTLLTSEQKNELVLKLENLPEVLLDQDKLKAKTISKKEIENRVESLDRFCYGIVSFPIIQEGKDGTLYGIIYKMSDICPVSHPGSNLHIYRKMNTKWEYFCIVNVSV